jgi:hypothetical protein
MFTISWNYKEFANEISFKDKEAANEVWQILRTTPDVTNLKPEPEKKYIAVRVVFTPGGKRYTYLSKSKLNVGDTAVVWTTDGRQFVKVIECAEVTKSYLEKTLPFSKYRYIEGKVVAA